MGAEEAKQEDAKEAEKPKQEDKEAVEEKEEKLKEENKEEKSQEEKKEEGKPSPPPPIILFVDLHCVGCAKKIQRSILKCRGVEEIEMNIEKNEVTVKGIVDPQILCSLIQKKTSRNAKVLSPPPISDDADSTKADSPPPQGGVIATVELIVNMHCEACAQQLRKKIIKMRGVQSAETDLSAKKVTVTGSMNGDKLVEYIHRRTGKIARIVPPPPKEEEKKTEEGEKKTEEKNPPENKGDEKKEEGEKPSDASAEASKEEPKKEDAAAAQPMSEEMVKRMIYWSGGGGGGGFVSEEEMVKRMNMMQWLMPALVPTQMPMYVVERPPLQLPPPPQMFSDENPNACSIS